MGGPCAPVPLNARPLRKCAAMHKERESGPARVSSRRWQHVERGNRVDEKEIERIGRPAAGRRVHDGDRIRSGGAQVALAEQDIERPRAHEGGRPFNAAEPRFRVRHEAAARDAQGHFRRARDSLGSPERGDHRQRRPHLEVDRVRVAATRRWIVDAKGVRRALRKLRLREGGLDLPWGDERRARLLRVSEKDLRRGEKARARDRHEHKRASRVREAGAHRSDGGKGMRASPNNEIDGIRRPATRPRIDDDDLPRSGGSEITRGQQRTKLVPIHELRGTIGAANSDD